MQQRGLVFTRHGARQGDAFQPALNLAMNLRFERPHFRDFDSVITTTVTHAVIAGLLAVLALELGVTHRQLGIKDVVKRLIKIDHGLLKRNRIEAFEPVIFARLFRHGQQGFHIPFGIQLGAMTLVLTADDMQSLVVRKAHRTELAV